MTKTFNNKTDHHALTGSDLPRSKYDLTPSQVVGMIKIKGNTLRNLSRANGLGADTLRNAFYRPCPKYERIIANFLEKEPADIWPSRYQK